MKLLLLIGNRVWFFTRTFSVEMTGFKRKIKFLPNKKVIAMLIIHTTSDRSPPKTDFTRLASEILKFMFFPNKSRDFIIFRNIKLHNS